MARHARILPPSGMLHLIGRGNNKIQLFRAHYDFERFWNILLHYTLHNEIFIHHYAFMSTHIHLLAWVERTDLLASTMKAINITYHHYYSKKYRYQGHLWHSRYRSVIINDESQWLQCGRYIELNPVHAGLCSNPKDYAWSSYHYYAYGKHDVLIRPIFHTSEMNTWKPGIKNTTYCEFVMAGIDMDHHDLKRQFERGRSPKK